MKTVKFTVSDNESVHTIELIHEDTYVLKGKTFEIV